MRILFALAGLHRVHRGAEVAFIAVARELSKLGHEVTLIGSGQVRPDEPYRFLHAPAIARERFERFPKFATLRGETSWEEATFLPGLLARYRPSSYDVTATCAFPYTHWALKRPVAGGRRPKHVFITQNGDWPAQSEDAEFRFFDCDGLVCINPDYFERNRRRFRSALIPNGVDLDQFHPGPPDRARFGLPADGKIVLMVSALIPSKNVAEGIAAVAQVPDARLVVAGDGPLREELRQQAANLLPGRFHQLTVPAAEMPALYRSADVFLHLSRDESFGNVFVEAMATGLPTVAFDSAKTRWIIGDEEHFPAERSAAAIASAVGAALEQGEEERPKRLARVRSFSWPEIGRQYEKFFEQVIG